jgi:hypothetical protein
MKLYSAIELHSNNLVLTITVKQDQGIFERRVPNKLEATLEALTPHKNALCAFAKTVLLLQRSTHKNTC